MTRNEALALVKAEIKAGHVASYYVEDGVIMAESPEGGFYQWFPLQATLAMECRAALAKLKEAK